jgi:EAL domain-containing protein (putative c-di-GMP-specific phosphodiesterase class I)
MTKTPSNIKTKSDKEFTKIFSEAKYIAGKLHDLLHEEALHRLELYKKYPDKPEKLNWTPSFYQTCQLAEFLCKKLNSLNVDPSADTEASHQSDHSTNKNDLVVSDN